MRAREPNPGAGPRATRSPSRADAHPLLALQRTMGNRATAEVVQLARQVGHDPLPPPPLPKFEFRACAATLRRNGARPGESSPMVLRLQVLLNVHLGGRVLNADGVYGPKTEEQVMLFQLSRQHQPPAPPGPNPLPPPLPPPDPQPITPDLPVTGEADPATVDALEAEAEERDVLLHDVDVAKEAFRLVRDNRKRLRLSLLSAMRNVEKLVDMDEIWEHFPGSEFDYWEAVAQHANGNTTRAGQLYDSALDGDDSKWEGLHANIEFQLDLLERFKPPEVEPNPDPNLAENEPE